MVLQRFRLQNHKFHNFLSHFPGGKGVTGIARAAPPVNGRLPPKLIAVVVQDLRQKLVEEDTPEDDPQDDCQEQADHGKDDPRDRHALASGVQPERAQHDPDHTEDAAAP